MSNTKNNLKDIAKKIDRLSQLHELTSIETILVTLWIAALVLSITLLVTVRDFWWIVTAVLLIPFNLYPLIMFLSQFLSNAENRFRNLKGILLTESLYLITFALIFLTFQSIIFFNITADIRPFFIFIVFECWGIFIYFWDTKFEKNIDEKFSYLISEVKLDSYILITLKNFIKTLTTKGLAPLIIVIAILPIYWSLLLNDIFQVLLIAFIGVVDVVFVIYNRKYRKNKKANEKKKSYKKVDKDLDISQKSKRKASTTVEYDINKLQLYQFAFTSFTAVLMVITVVLAYQTAIYNKSVVDWYENPKPLLIHWSLPVVSEEQDIDWRIGVLESYNPEIGIENNPRERWGINVTIRNVGRAPLANGRISLSFTIDNLTEENYPIMPFKIINYKNPVDSLTFKEDFNRSNQTMLYNDRFIHYENRYKVNDFPPTINYSNGKAKLSYPIPNLRIGSLGPQEETWVYLQMFATKENATGFATLKVTGSNTSPYPIILPLESHE